MIDIRRLDKALRNSTFRSQILNLRNSELYPTPSKIIKIQRMPSIIVQQQMFAIELNRWAAECLLLVQAI